MKILERFSTVYINPQILELNRHNFEPSFIRNLHLALSEKEEMIINFDKMIRIHWEL